MKCLSPLRVLSCLCFTQCDSPLECVCLCVSPDRGHEPTRFWEREDKREMNCSSSTPASSLLLREQFVGWRMRDSTRRWTCSWILWWSPASAVHVSALLQAYKWITGGCKRQRQVLTLVPRSLNCCLHLCKATRWHTLLWSSGTVAGGEMNFNSVMPPGLDFASSILFDSFPSFQSQTIF